MRPTIAGERTRDAILSVVIDLAATEGLCGLSIGRLADELGMSKSGLFRHFGSKEDLEVAAVEAASAIFVEEVVRPALRVERGTLRLWALFTAWVSYARKPSGPGGCFFASVASEFDGRPGRVRDRIAKVMSDWISVLENAAEQAKEAGHLTKQTDSRQIAFEIHALAEGANAWHLLHDDESVFERVETAVAQRIRAAATPACPPLPTSRRRAR